MIPIERLNISAFTIPTAADVESDGTLAWNKTTIVVVEAQAGGCRSLGYCYADLSTAHLAESALKPVLMGKDALAVRARWLDLVHAIRNLGRPGVCSMAIAAIDNSLWDLKSRICGVSLFSLLGPVRDSVPAYGSGAFTSYTPAELEAQVVEWKQLGLSAMKMKVGTDPDADVARVRTVRKAAGDDARVFVDANGAYSRKQALEKTEQFDEWGVSWFEEPVSSDDLEGLRLIRDRAPARMEIAAGEYGYSSVYFRRMLQSGAVDVLQADATRCAGVTGFMQVEGLCQGFGIPLSAHTAPSLHAHLCCAAVSARDVEYFYDHVRIERMFFDGALTVENGMLRPDPSRPGLGLELKHLDVEKYRIYGDPNS